VGELTKIERFSYASSKVSSAFKWMFYSGTLTFFLTGLLNVIAEVRLPYWVSLLVYLVINTILYGVAKYVEGEKPSE